MDWLGVDEIRMLPHWRPGAPKNLKVGDEVVVRHCYSIGSAVMHNGKVGVVAQFDDDDVFVNYFDPPFSSPGGWHSGSQLVFIRRGKKK